MAPFDGAFHQPPFWHRDAVRGPSTPSFDHIVSRPQAALGRSARFKAARTMGNLACWRKTVAHSMTPPDEPSCRIFVVPGPIKRLNRSLPREASGDDPRGQLVGMVRRRLWIDLGRSPDCFPPGMYQIPPADLYVPAVGQLAWRIFRSARVSNRVRWRPPSCGRPGKHRGFGWGERGLTAL